MLPKWPNDRSSHKIFGAVSEDLLGGTGKAEDAKLQGAGIIPKLCPMEREEMEAMYRNWAEPSNEYRSHNWRKKERRNSESILAFFGARLWNLQEVLDLVF